MSRSRKRTPIFGITTATSEKQDKRRWNKLFRRSSKQSIAGGKEPPVSMNEVSNVWSGDKDGKRYWHKHTKKDLRK